MLATQRRFGALWLATGMVVFSGCSGPVDPTASIESSTPAIDVTTDRGDVVLEAPKSSGGLFYPLDLGNHWGYVRTFEYQIIPTGGQPSDPTVINATIDVDLVGTGQRYGREYVVQREVIHEDGSDYPNDYFYRQDRSGLFNADPEPTAAGTRASRARVVERRVAAMLAQQHIEGPSASRAYQKALLDVLEKHEMIRHLVAARPGAGTEAVAAGPLEGEIALLLYPLHPHKSWHAREDPLFVYTVERQENLDLPAGRFNGWRIRIDSELFGTNARVHVWYGRDGQLKLAAHFEGEATDENGNVLGSIVSDEENLLSDLDITRVLAVAKRRP